MEKFHSSLESTEKGQHASEKLKCELSSVKTNIRQNLSRHIHGMHNDKMKPKQTENDIIEDCGTPFPSKSELEEHMATATGFEKKIFKCEQCTYKTAHKTGLKKHVREGHGSIESILCNKCYFATSLKASLINHIKCVHNMGDKQFKCNKCPYSSALKGNLKMHTESVHNLGERKFKCDKCPYKSNLKGNVKSHTESVHNMGEKKFKCDICPYKSHFKGSLKIHVNNVHLKIGAKKTKNNKKPVC